MSTTPSGAAIDALVLLAHGSADARWRQPFEALAASLAARAAGVSSPSSSPSAPQGREDRPPALVVELCYLQLCPPDLEQALERCVARGARRVRVLPLFLSGGGHLLRDVPDAVKHTAARFPALMVETSGALGEEPEVVAGLLEACLRLARG